MEPWLITAGRVYDGVAEKALERAYVTIDEDTITAVGPQTELEGHTGHFARVIDLGAEATVLPGLSNMHTHMSFSAGTSICDDHQRESYETKLIRAVENLQAALRTGVTTVCDYGTLNGIAFAVRAAVESGLLLGPRVIASGAGITTTGGHLWFCGIEADSAAEIRRAVRAQVKAGVDFIKVFATGGNSTPGTNAFAAQYRRQRCAPSLRRRDVSTNGSPRIRTAPLACARRSRHA
jgi:imidazolonepropionase-like amidohydrolase